MSKAVQGAAMIAAGVGLAAFAFFVPPFGILTAHVMVELLVAGAGMAVSGSASLIADALATNRGMAISTRQAAGFRQIVYGIQRIGGTTIYQSTTGAGGSGGHYVYNFVIVLATHEIDAIQNIYLDGRQVFFRSDGSIGNVGCGRVSTPPATTVTISNSGPITNFLTNPSFQTGDFTGWTLQTAGWAINPQGPPFGNVAYFTYAPIITNSAITNKAQIAATPGVQVTASCQAVGEPGATGYGALGIAFYDNTGAMLGSPYYSNHVTNNYIWTSLSVTATAPAGSAYALVSFGVFNVISAGGRWFCYQFVGGCINGSVTGITATGGSGFANVAPARYRVRIYGGGGQGAAAYATGSPSAWVVHLTAGGAGYTTAPTAEIQGAYTFGGHARSDDPDPFSGGYHKGYGIGPGGQHYNFDGKVYAEARFGDQLPGDIIQELATNDSAWLSHTTAQGGTPYVGGCAYLYVNVGRDSAMFPTYPEIRITVNGKTRIFDPRTGKSTFSTNWALCVADVLTDVQFGVGDPSVNLAQWIAAANVCDEPVTSSQGMEKRYTLNLHYDTSTSPGDALGMMMPCAAGRASYIGGEWFIWPAYWQGSSFNYDQSALIEAPVWNPYRSFRDLVNRVTGTYTAANYPYNVAGNLYDRNGWYYGTKENVWAFAFQPTNFPQYAADPLHGFASDVFLTEDGGVQLPQEITLRGVISIAQAQRIAKIFLMRNRKQGSGNFRMTLGAWQMQEADVMQFTFSQMSWANKYLEVVRVEFAAEQAGDNSGAVQLTTAVAVIETAPDVYEWSIGEELTPYDVAAAPGSISANPLPPTNLNLEDDASTALMLSNGQSIPRLLITWTPPDDVYVNIGGHIQVQYQDSEQQLLDGAWISAGTFAGDSTACYIDGIAQVTTLNARARSIRDNGAMSDWAYYSNYDWTHPQGTLTGTMVVTGTTPNAPVSTTGMRALPELDNITVNLSGNPVFLSLNMQFAARGSGGAVTSIGATFGNAVGQGHPTVNVVITGDGAGASATVTWYISNPSGPSGPTWSSTINLTGGSNYTIATASVTSSAGQSTWTPVNGIFACTVSSITPSPNVPASVQVLMDGLVILGPSTVSTDATGTAALSPAALISPAPAAGNHTFVVQASTTSSIAVVSTSRTFSLMNLS